MSLIDALSSIGLIVNEPILDNQIHRVGVADKAKNLDGWYVAKQLNDQVFADFGRWDTDEKYKYPSDNDKDYGLSDADRISLKLLAEESKREKLIMAGSAAETAAEIWEKSEEKQHDYLAKKCISAHGLRVEGSTGALIMPLYDQTGALTTLQRIWAQGGSKDGIDKKLLSGGQKAGSCYPINGATDIIFICEGFATAATVNEITGNKTLVAVDCGNLAAVAKTAKDMYRESVVVIAADNDHGKERNPGLDKGKEISKNLKLKLVFPPGTINGSDFNDMSSELGQEETKKRLLSWKKPKKNIKKQLGLNVPVKLFQDCGLISVGLQGLIDAGAPDIPQYNLPAIFTVLANSIADKINFRGVYPNLYNIKVGGTSTGKTICDKILRFAIRESGIENFYGMTDFASGPALYRGLQNNPSTILLIDEITKLFRRADKIDQVTAGKIDALLEIYSQSGLPVSKVFGNSKNAIDIDSVCLTVSGNGTPEIFDTIRLEDFETGLIQRFDFWYYDDKIPYRNLTNDTKNLNIFINGINDLVKSETGTELQAALGSSIEIGQTEQCRKRLEKLSHDVIDAANKSHHSGEIGIISRKYDLSIKYALIHIAATRPATLISEDMDLSDIEFGIQVAEMLATWKINVLSKKVNAGDLDRDCKIFLDAVEVVEKIGKKPTFNLLRNRRRQLNNWSMKYSSEIITILQKRGEINCVEDDVKGRITTVYNRS